MEDENEDSGNYDDAVAAASARVAALAASHVAADAPAHVFALASSPPHHHAAGTTTMTTNGSLASTFSRSSDVSSCNSLCKVLGLGLDAGMGALCHVSDPKQSNQMAQDLVKAMKGEGLSYHNGDWI